MLKIEPPNYQFCPFCGKKLEIKLEENRERKFCSSCKWTYYPHVATTVAAVIIRNGKAIMVKRAREPYKNTWMFPAGFVDYGECPEETLAREIREETGLEIIKAILLRVVQIEDDPRSPGHFCLFYKVKVGGHKLKTDKEENQGIGWFDIKNPPEIGWESHQQVIKLLQKEIRKS